MYQFTCTNVFSWERFKYYVYLYTFIFGHLLNTWGNAIILQFYEPGTKEKKLISHFIISEQWLSAWSIEIQAENQGPNYYAEKKLHEEINKFAGQWLPHPLVKTTLHLLKVTYVWFSPTHSECSVAEEIIFSCVGIPFEIKPNSERWGVKPIEFC